MKFSSLVLRNMRTLMRQTPLRAVQAKTYRKAAVLVPLCNVNGVASLLFNVRTMSVTHPGQVCFPGGGIDAGETPEQAALREFREEMRVDWPVEVVSAWHQGQNNKGVCVTPIVGFINKELDAGMLEQLAPAPDEVDSVFHLPVETLADIEFQGTDEYEWKGEKHVIRNYTGGPVKVKGLTAWFTTQLLEPVLLKTLQGDGFAAP
eukprot:TRINITY_DN28480_c0_g1_i1.p1 TRINITY_DN28480_c0_g1~~TRINITY_DN28480_c0_g1_i1.p1  ORF type:complete len:205 (-),score=19.53 TRINITY_DN28480_c0_g1_i1:210-824(-)